MIKHELGQVISADLSLYKIKYKIIETYERDQKTMALYAAYCLPLNIYEYYEKLSKKLRIKLIGIDISSNCLNNIFEQNIEPNNIILDSKDAYAFVNIHLDMIFFSVINKGANDFFMISNIESNGGNTAEIVYDWEDMYIWVEVLTNVAGIITRLITKVDRIYLYGHKPFNGLDKLLSSFLHLEAEYINSLPNVVIADNSINEYFISVISMYNIKSSFLTKNEEKTQVLVSLAGISVLLLFALLLLKHSMSIKEQIAKLNIHINNEINIERNDAIEKLKSENQLLNSSIASIETAINLVNNENVRTENIRVYIIHSRRIQRFYHFPLIRKA